MHTIQTTIVFSVLLIILCGFLAINPSMYARTDELARLSVSCQKENNEKKAIFEIRTKRGKKHERNVEISCPEKAYRLGKGVRDSLDLIID